MVRLGKRLRVSRPRRERGFTLIEVLLAVGILAIILAMVYASFDQTSRVNTHVREVSDQFRMARLALSKMSDLPARRLAPCLGSRAPKTRRATRAFLRAPMHMRQGSSVT